MDVNIRFTVNLPKTDSNINLIYNRSTREIGVDAHTLERIQSSLETLKELKEVLSQTQTLLEGRNIKANPKNDTALKIVEYIKSGSSDNKFLSIIKKAVDKKADPTLASINKIKQELNAKEQALNYQQLALSMQSTVENLKQNKPFINTKPVPPGMMYTGNLGQDISRFLTQKEVQLQFISDKNSKHLFKDVNLQSDNLPDQGERTQNYIYNIFEIAYGPNFETKDATHFAIYATLSKDFDEAITKDMFEYMSIAINNLVKQIISSKDPKDQMAMQLFVFTLSQEISNNLLEPLASGRANKGVYSELQIPETNLKELSQKITIDTSQQGKVQLKRSIDIPFVDHALLFHGDINIKMEGGKVSEGSILREIKLNEKADIKDEDLKFGEGIINTINDQEKKYDVDFGIHVHLERAKPRPKLGDALKTNVQPQQRPENAPPTQSRPKLGEGFKAIKQPPPKTEDKAQPRPKLTDIINDEKSKSA